MTRLMLLGLALLISAGCASHTPRAFEGKDRPDDQVAVLQIDPDVRFVSLDGQSVKGVPAELNSGLPTPSDEDRRFIRMLPGEHRIVAGYAPYADEPWLSRSPGGSGAARKTYTGSAENDELLFTAVAGKRYLLKLDRTYKLDTDPPMRWSVAVYDQDRSVSQTISAHTTTTRP